MTELKSTDSSNGLGMSRRYFLKGAGVALAAGLGFFPKLEVSPVEAAPVFKEAKEKEFIPDRLTEEDIAELLELRDSIEFYSDDNLSKVHNGIRTNQPQNFIVNDQSLTVSLSLFEGDFGAGKVTIRVFEEKMPCLQIQGPDVNFFRLYLKRFSLSNDVLEEMPVLYRSSTIAHEGIHAISNVILLSHFRKKLFSPDNVINGGNSETINTYQTDLREAISWKESLEMDETLIALLEDLREEIKKSGTIPGKAILPDSVKDKIPLLVLYEDESRAFLRSAFYWHRALKEKGYEMAVQKNKDGEGFSRKQECEFIVTKDGINSTLPMGSSNAARAYYYFQDVIKDCDGDWDEFTQKFKKFSELDGWDDYTKAVKEEYLSTIYEGLLEAVRKENSPDLTDQLDEAIKDIEKYSKK